VVKLVIRHWLGDRIAEVLKQPRAVAILSLIWWLGISSIAFLWRLGYGGLVDETEPLFAEAARQMMETGDWLTPYFNGQPRFDKPPLIYWLMAIAYQVFGVNSWSVRLPSALAAMALMGLGMYTLLTITARQRSLLQKPQLCPWGTAWMGAAMIGMNLLTIVWSRVGVSDMVLTGCLGSALLCFFQGYSQPNTKAQNYWYLAFYGLIALAILTKGPIGLILPGLTLACFFSYLGTWRRPLRELRWRRGLAIVGAITLPWYIAMVWVNGYEYVQTFFGYHNLERFTQVVNRHAGPWYFYIPVVLVGLAPWSCFLPLAIARLQCCRRSYWQQQPRVNQLGLFALCWLGSVFIFFTLAATKLPSYVLPMMPAGAILITLLWQDSRSNSWAWSVSGYTQTLLLLSLAIALPWISQWLGGDPFQEVVQESGLLIWGSLILGSAGLISLIVCLQRRVRWLWPINLLSFTVFLLVVLLPTAALVDGQRQLPLRQLAATIGQVRQPGERLMMVGFKKPSLTFYTQQPVRYRSRGMDARQDLNIWAREHPQPATALIVTNPKKLMALQLQPQQYELIDQAGTYRLIRVTLPSLVLDRP